MEAMKQIAANDTSGEKFGGARGSSGNCNVGFNSVDFAPVLTDDDVEIFERVLYEQVFHVCDPAKHSGAKAHGGMGEEHEWEMFFELVK